MRRGFSVNPKDAVPIWRQIELGVMRLIGGGRLRPGAAIPSVRDMARDLGVNPMTVAKAYQKLAEAGLVDSRRGEGTFVAEFPAVVDPAQRTKILREEAERFAAVAATLGAKQAEGLAAVRAAFERIRNRTRGSQ